VSAARSAAQYAAWSAAEPAAWSVQNKTLKEFIQEARQGYNHWEFTL
jgi:hypothetical protein